MKLFEFQEQLRAFSVEAKEFEIFVFRSNYQDRIGDYPLSKLHSTDWGNKKIILFAVNDT